MFDETRLSIRSEFCSEGYKLILITVTVPAQQMNCKYCWSYGRMLRLRCS